ncbi:hypothetical protein [Streptomyces sp. NPDC005799]|uniref:hypothetical protein n=1 Tax=Streptomyces sp. NPDC005799 TaxID=3154678 RepID=UPI00340D128F
MTVKTSQEDELRTVLTTLVERWQEQLDEYTERASTTVNERYARYARIRATRVRACITELKIVLNTGHLPYDLMTDDELAALSLTREDAEIVEIAEAGGQR